MPGTSGGEVEKPGFCAFVAPFLVTFFFFCFVNLSPDSGPHPRFEVIIMGGVGAFHFTEKQVNLRAHAWPPNPR